MRYKRVLLKLSGGAISGPRDSGFDPESLEHIADEILDLHGRGVEIGIVIGGGNILRGSLGAQWGIDRAEADNIGMLGTIINALMLRGVLNAKSDVEVRVMTAIPINAVAEPFIRLVARRHMDKGYIVIFAGGIGNPYVTTDYPGIQRALEVQADAILFAKNKTNGIYTDDPNKNSSAKRYHTINYNTVVQENLGALDQTAVLLARDHHLPIHVFDFEPKGYIKRIVDGEDVGTLITQTPEDTYAD
ncbi:MAG: UMP kinase [Candidatus Latescibacteria bacterium]|jgi:uridylate kinase|nr:UMP kinase [Candidatus Latescibacterota bacterium]MBT4139076.1 UMP kinase [Candidatus Latescibacterota bacterium]MBT5830756.1 UMP kinase [Candidatus Latescibacterota bacterium]